jgi:hypothetical protein
MKRNIPVAFSTLVLLSVGVGVMPAWSSEHRSTKSASPKNDQYAVVQVGEDFKVIRNSEVRAEEKRVTDQYNDETKKWKEEKKKDPKYDKEKPVKAKFVILRKSIKSQKEAQEYADKLKKDKAEKGKDDTF